MSETIREVWVPIPDFPGYEISDLGQVRSFLGHGDYRINQTITSNSRVLSPCFAGKYAHLTLRNAAGRHTRLVHRLVLLSFIGPPPHPTWHASHRDGNRANNRLNNLRWLSVGDNNRERAEHGTMPIGEKNKASKLTENDVFELRRLFKAGAKKSQLAKRFGINESTVARAIFKITWKHVP